MSRWREMMMDYGQIFGSDKSAKSLSSNVFTIDNDLKDKRKSDLQLRRHLEVQFRPLFQRFVYGGEKIACHDLRRVLQDPLYRDSLPPDKIQELADLTDFNRGKAITYNEFVNIVLNQLPMDDLASQGSLNDLSSRSRGTGGSPRFQYLMASMCTTTAPPEIVEKKMETYRCLPPPFFMILITLAQIIMYIVVNRAEDVTLEALEGVAPGNAIMYTPTRRREAWRWVSYCLLHQGYVDLICNVILQLFIGVPLEMAFSWWRVAIVYIGGVIVGSCGQSITDPYVGLVGAAGGTYALIMAHIVALIIHRQSYKKTWIVLKVVLIFLVVIPQLVLAVYRRFFFDGIGIKIGIGAHVAGLLTGASMSDAFLTDPLRSPAKFCACGISLFTFLFVLGLTIVVNIVSYDYPDEDYS